MGWASGMKGDGPIFAFPSLLYPSPTTSFPRTILPFIQTVSSLFMYLCMVFSSTSILLPFIISVVMLLLLPGSLGTAQEAQCQDKRFTRQEAQCRDRSLTHQEAHSVRTRASTVRKHTVSGQALHTSGSKHTVSGRASHARKHTVSGQASHMSGSTQCWDRRLTHLRHALYHQVTFPVPIFHFSQ